jgi:hypothetical protein
MNDIEEVYIQHMNTIGDSANTLLAFIESAKDHGASDDFLLRLLADRGWPEKKVYEAFALHYERATGVPVPARAGGVGEAARDAFFYLLSFSMLGVWTIALGTLVFSYLEKWLPDALSGRSYQDAAFMLSANLAMAMVGFPLYMVTMRFIVRELGAHPEKHDSGVRKWLTYIALFLAAGIVAGDLITFLSYFLRGEITVRFVLKVATAGVIAGGVFWYYLGFLKPPSEAGAAGRMNRIFALASAAAVVVVVGVGFTLLGSPRAQRLVSADRQRVEDLQAIAREMHLRRGRPGGADLPEQLDQMTFGQPGMRLRLKDPETQIAYEYHKRGQTSYELCAVFATASDLPQDGRPLYWNHPRGRNCYALDSTVAPWTLR